MPERMIHIPGFGIEAFTYFSLGAYCGVNKKNMVALARKIEIPSYVVCAITFALSIFGLPDVGVFSMLRAANLLFIFSGGVSIINVSSRMLDNGKVQVYPLLAKSSFMVFAAHGLLLSVINPIFGHIFISDSIVSNILDYFLLPLTTSLVCVAAYYILTRYFPRLSLLLVGSRSSK